MVLREVIGRRTRKPGKDIGRGLARGFGEGKGSQVEFCDFGGFSCFPLFLDSYFDR